MSEQATRKDIDDVIDILKDFMRQTADQFTGVSNQFTEVKSRLTKIDDKYYHLINTI